LEKPEDFQPRPELNPPSPEQQLRPGEPPIMPPAGPGLQGEEAPAIEVEPTIRQWLTQNVPVLIGFAALIVLLHYLLGWDLATIAKVAVGLSFIIFIHELGHFLVAKWCDVHVQTFSIGFGPAIPGCKFTWGETTYKISLIPLGGYVQMVGQVDGDESADGSEDDPRSYRNKSVWQRMAIISAGVTMNALLAVVCFVVVFMIPGKDRKAGVVGTVDSGGAAFQANITSGAWIRQIGNVQDPYFEQLMVTVMATESGEKLPLRLQRADGSEQSLKIEPRVGAGRPMLGIAPAERLTLVSRRHYGRDLDRPVWPGTAADRAKGAFKFGDQIIACTDPESGEVTDLPKDWRKPDNSGPDYQRDYFTFAKRMRQLAGKEVTIRVLRGRPGHQKTVDITVPPAFHKVLGARMLMGEITVVCDGTKAAECIQPRNKAKDQEGDVITKVEVQEPDGRTTTYSADVAQGPGVLDPERLPDQLRAWAQRLAKAGKPGPWHVTLSLYRHTKKGKQMHITEVVKLPWDATRTYDSVAPLGPTSPLAIPELGLGYMVKTTVAGVDPELAGKGDETLQPGDVIEKCRPYLVGKDGKITEKSWFEMKEDQWACTFFRLQETPLAKVKLAIKRNGQAREITVVPKEDTTWPLARRGLVFDLDQRLQKADNFLQAVGMGLDDTYNTMRQVFWNLRGMATGRISVEQLGGPVTIATVAYKIAGIDFWEFIFFLGLISINLAVINFLPIPILDGGHMVFLLYEKIRGKPASEQVRVGATYAGLLLLACLMIFVLYLDINRIIKGG
jgi:regulator of sigma E protease